MKKQNPMNSYTIKSRLGQGAFSTVYKVLRKQDNLEYAMKKIRILSLSEKEVSNCLNEVRILASIDHPNIVSYKDSFFDQLTNTFCIVTELVEGGDLGGVIMKNKALKSTMNEDFIWQVATQVLQGLQALHQSKVMHRDIKSANIFLTKNCEVAKLGDMNVSIISNNGMAKTQTGTPYYASPQVWKEMPYNSKCDVWSLGCVLYEMATLKPPFEGHDLRTLKKNIMAGVYKRIPKAYSQQLEMFIRMCLKVRPQDRSSVSELLNSAYLKKKCTIKRQPSMQKSLNSIKMLQKIQVPNKRQFKLIRTRLPPNKFSTSMTKSQKGILQNNSAVLESNKQNQKPLNTIQCKSNRILKKQPDSLLSHSTKLRSMSTNNPKEKDILPPLKQQEPHKSIFNKINKPSDIPNIPKPKILRA